ncbi:MAG: hypothetical protein Q9159_006096 [Coniocarpon cinnabarinum]
MTASEKILPIKPANKGKAEALGLPKHGFSLWHKWWTRIKEMFWRWKFKDEDMVMQRTVEVTVQEEPGIVARRKDELKKQWTGLLFILKNYDEKKDAKSAAKSEDLRCVLYPTCSDAHLLDRALVPFYEELQNIMVDEGIDVELPKLNGLVHDHFQAHIGLVSLM